MIATLAQISDHKHGNHGDRDSTQTIFALCGAQYAVEGG